MNLQHTISRMKQIALWILHGKYYILSIASFLATILYLIGILKFYPRAVALIMTLSGLLILITQQIIDAKKFSFHKPNTFSGWLKSFPTKRTINLSSNGLSIAVLMDKAHLTVSISDDATIEKKVDFLLRQVAVLDSAIGRVDDRVDEVKSMMLKTSKQLQASVSTVEMTLNQIIASHVVGSYDIMLFGINITICGTIIQFFC